MSYLLGEPSQGLGCWEVPHPTDEAVEAKETGAAAVLAVGVQAVVWGQDGYSQVREDIQESYTSQKADTKGAMARADLDPSGLNLLDQYSPLGCSSHTNICSVTAEAS